jgi:magnesium transporter
MQQENIQNHRYPKNSAGKRMTTNVPRMLDDELLSDVHDLLHEKAKNYDTVNYVYIVDQEKKLVGVLSIREIFTLDQTLTVGVVGKKHALTFVHPEAHQERAAYLALRHNIKAIPVVDKQKVFLGEISANSILSILQKEMREDSFKKAGISHPSVVHMDIFEIPFLLSLRHRLPWLIIGLGGGIFAAQIVGFFEETLSSNLILAAFIPLIVYISSAAGVQMEAYIIRDLAVVQNIPFRRYFYRHFLLVMAIAAILAMILFGSFGLLYQNWHVSAVLSVSLFISVSSSVLTGLLIPYTFSKLHFDPADASGPIATIIQDIISIVLYLSIATAFL